MRKSNKKLKSQMFQLIKTWEESGIPKKTFAREQGLTISKFKYWLYKYKNRNVVSKKGQVTEKTFIPIDVLSPRPADKIEIQYPNGVRVLLSNTFSLEEVKYLITIL